MVRMDRRGFKEYMGMMMLEVTKYSLVCKLDGGM